jgi:hypothetical protein
MEIGRLLLLSQFEKRPRRPTTESSHQRNELLAALSDEIFIIHAEPDGSIEQISKLIERLSIPRRNGESSNKMLRWPV